MEITEDRGSDAYLQLLHYLLTSNDVDKVAPRGQATLEARDVTLRVRDAGEVHVLRTLRRPNLRIAATEAMHLVGGLSSLEQLDAVSRGAFSQFANGGRLLGAYGPRAHRQLPAVERLLRRDHGTRQAVVSLWTGDEHDAASRDVPCTTTLQFFLRRDLLHLRVTMRSNDAWLGLPYDLMMFSCLQRAMACALDVEPGEYTHSVGSMHLYERDLDAAHGVAFEDADRKPLVDNEARCGIPVPLFHVEHRAFEDLATNAAAVCLNTLTGWVTPNADWLRHHVAPLGPDQALCLNCRYVTTGDNCDTCNDELHRSETP